MSNETRKVVEQLEDDIYQTACDLYWLVKEISQYNTKHKDDWKKYCDFLNSIGIGPEEFDDDYEEN